MRRLIAVLMLLLALPARAEPITIHAAEGSFDDVKFAVENAIVERGLVVDHISDVGAMLKRTGADLGNDKKIFDAANVFMFCSAVISRKMMEADPTNIAYCPYRIFVTDTNGTVHIGYRNFPDGPMQEVQSLLDSIARDAAGQ